MGTSFSFQVMLISLNSKLDPHSVEHGSFIKKKYLGIYNSYELKIKFVLLQKLVPFSRRHDFFSNNYKLLECNS